jgi:hypothetical protein
VIDLLVRLEQTGLGTWVRESPSLLAYPTILFMHTLGLGLLVGINTAVSLRLLGFAPGLPLGGFTRLFPLMWVGFWINALSGVALTIADASFKLTNWAYYVKMVFIGLAVVNLWLMGKRVFGRADVDDSPLPENLKTLALVSLICWIGAITFGRLLAYVGPVAGLLY